MKLQVTNSKGTVIFERRGSLRELKPLFSKFKVTRVPYERIQFYDAFIEVEGYRISLLKGTEIKVN